MSHVTKALALALVFTFAQAKPAEASKPQQQAAAKKQQWFPYRSGTYAKKCDDKKENCK